MAKPKKYEVTITNLRGIGIKQETALFTLESAIYWAETTLLCQGLLSYDKVWRAIKFVGAYSQVCELPILMSPHAPTLAVLIIAPQDAAPVNSPRDRPRTEKPEPVAKIPEGWPYAGSLDMYEDMGVKRGHPIQEEHIAYSYRVYYSYLNFITKKPNKTEYHEEVEASTEAEAVARFPIVYPVLNKKNVVVRRVEVAGSL